MSAFHDFKLHIIKTEMVDFIVPERLRSARELIGLTLPEAAEKLQISKYTLGLYENGHREIPKEMLFKLMNAYSLPKNYFYEVRWERV